MMNVDLLFLKWTECDLEETSFTAEVFGGT